MFLCKRKDGEVFEAPASKRGNSTYAWRTAKQFLIYKQGFLQGVAENSVMFITLVASYGNSYYECRDSWKVISKSIGPFIKTLKKIGAEKYVAILEATREGNCHAHLLIKWNRSLRVRIYNGKSYLGEKKLLKVIGEKWNNEWGKVSALKLNKNAVAIRICPNLEEAGKTFDYITKHLGRGSDITRALYNVKQNKSDINDLVKLFTNYWAYKLNTRLYRVSKNWGKEK